MRYSVMMIPVLAFACGAPDGDDVNPDAMLDTTTIGIATDPATAVLQDSTGREVGRFTLTDSDSGLAIVGRVVGFAQGERGIHIHAVGACAPDFAAAAGHWNPTGREHGSENPAGSHLGDLGNLQFGADSTAELNVVVADATLRGANAVIDADGAALMVHAGPDDLRTDPDGAAGPRIACGIIR